MTKIKRALISCTNKTKIEKLGKFLSDKGIEILSTGGTAKLLSDHGIPTTEVSKHTGSPEILDGRLKTLHPKIHGGILFKRGDAKHEKQITENAIEPIDLIVVNLYEFEKTITDPRCTLDHAIENIDIGGPTMLRSAAKNYRDVAVVVDPNDYEIVMEEIDKHGFVSPELKFKLATKVFQLTAAYDTAISQYLTSQLKSNEGFSNNLSLSLTKVQDLRYGENPHQRAALYNEKTGSKGVINAKQWQGKELSFNNILDMDAAYNCCREFNETACVIVKHLNPCGVAVAEKLSEAFVKAREGDPVSSFGGIVAMNKNVDKQTALIIAETFFEVILAPAFDANALEIFKNKKNLRIMSLNEFNKPEKNLDYRRISGGLLVQDTDTDELDVTACQVVTKRKPTKQEWSDLSFAWKIVKHVKSNAIVFSRANQSLGVGAGQMSRVDSVKIAAMKAKDNFNNKDILKNAVMASDAFFPFRDGVDTAIQEGVSAIIQPGGSMRDAEVIQACDEQGVTMVFTGMRHFKH